MRRISLTAVLALAACQPPPAVEVDAAPPPQTDRERASYGVGLNLGRSLRKNSLDLEPEWVLRGVQDGLNGRPEQLSQEQIAAALKAVRKPAPKPDVAPAHLERNCGRCHVTPRPEDLPRPWWLQVVEQMKALMEAQGPALTDVELREILSWYEGKAPRAFPTMPPEPAPSRLRFKPERLGALREVTAVTIADLGGGGPEVVVGSQDGQVVAVRAGGHSRLLGQAGVPVRFAVADLDGDKRPDLVVTDIGDLNPSTERRGRILVLHGQGDGRLGAPQVIARDLARPCDARAADMDGDGDLDLAVADFGWFGPGEILWLEQTTGAWRKHSVAKRTGVVDIHPFDLDGDGRADLLTLISQESEEIVAWHQGTRGFFQLRVYQADTPLYGSSSLERADLDGDGDLDLLYLNGDSQDSPPGAKPYHGVAWLENLDGGYGRHEVARLTEAFRGAAADLDGDGDLDLVVIRNFKSPDARAGLVWFEQTSDGVFSPYAVPESRGAMALAVGDLNGDGRPDIVTGGRAGATVWWNLGFAEDGTLQ